MQTHVAIISGLILEKNKDGKAIALAVDLDIIYDVFKVIEAWKAVEVYLGRDLNIKKSINALEEITFGSVLIQFAKSINKDIKLIPSITTNKDEQALVKDIQEYMEK